VVRVVHLTGSPVSAFLEDLSRRYAGDCIAATANPVRYEFLIAHVSPDGRWRFPDDLSRTALDTTPSLPLSEAIPRLLEFEPDVVVPQMFCIPGMTHYRSLVDTLGIPYVGQTPDAMALAAHKARAKAVVAAAGVRVPPGQVLRAGERPSLPLPLVVKPIDGDNSLGVGVALRDAELAGALAEAFAHADEVLVEKFIPLGREVRAGCIVRHGELVCLPIEEYALDPETAPIRTHSDKIARDVDGEIRLLAKVSSRAWIIDPGDPITAPVWDAAMRCHAALGARHYSLFDFRVDPAGVPWFLEASPYCSFAPASVIVTMAAAAGIPLDSLFSQMLNEARR
jgi:D-alanine-D-alanine ligase